MAQVYNKIYVDVRTETTDIVTAVQKDANSRFLDVYLKDNGLPINLTGHEVRIYGKKYDGTEIYNDGEITEAANGRCQFELTDQALALAQDLEVQIIIYYNNVQILQTFPFTIHVKKSLISKNAIESSNEYGALVVLYQNLYEAYDLMTTMVQNIGVPGEIAKQLTIDTMWDAWEYLCNYVSVDLTNLIQNALNNNSVDGVMQKLGETTDTGGTAATGTVMAKLNKAITKGATIVNTKVAVPRNTTNFTLLDIIGKGKLIAIMEVAKVEGVNKIITNYDGNSFTYNVPMGIHYGEVAIAPAYTPTKYPDILTYKVLNRDETGYEEIYPLQNGLEFNQSLELIVDNVYTDSRYIKLVYAIEE